MMQTGNKVFASGDALHALWDENKALKAEITRYRRALHNLKEDCTQRKHFAVSDEEKLFLAETLSHIEAELDFNPDTEKGEKNNE